nr:hypothetical protein [Mycobacterium persicum]
MAALITSAVSNSSNAINASHLPLPRRLVTDTVNAAAAAMAGTSSNAARPPSRSSSISRTWV